MTGQINPYNTNRASRTRCVPNTGSSPEPPHIVYYGGLEYHAGIEMRHQQLVLWRQLIVQNDQGNLSSGYANTIVVAVSTRGRDIPFHVFIPASKANGLAADSYARCEQSLTISKARPVGHRSGRIIGEQMAQVVEAFKRSLAIP